MIILDSFTNAFKLAISAAGAYLFGGFDLLMQLLCIVMAVDFITGILLAVVFRKSPKSDEGALSSTVAAKGAVRKVCQLMLVMIITRLGESLGDGQFCRNTAILFFSANEGISILENMGLMGVKYPMWLKKSLDVLLKNSDNVK